MPDLIATKGQRYGTRMLSAGEPFSASGPNSRLLIALKRAKPAGGREVPEPAASEDDIDALREKAESLGVDVDRRWGERRLKDEITKASDA